METVLTVMLITAGFVLGVAGVIGCLLPVVPGPPLGFIALLILSLVRHWEPFSTTFLVVMGGLTAGVVLLDYVLPSLGAKRYGASKLGVWGSMIGLLIGFFAFPPFGIFIGGFAGAVVGELFAGRAGRTALRAGWGVFVGNLLSITLKMGLSAVMLFFYIKAVVSG